MNNSLVQIEPNRSWVELDLKNIIKTEPIKFD